MVKKNEIMIVADYSQESPITFDELCEICNISVEYIHDLIDYDIIHLSGETPDEWMFDIVHLQRIKTALRLQRDLEVNLPGIALVLDLLDEIEQLRERAEFYDHYFSQK